MKIPALEAKTRTSAKRRRKVRTEILTPMNWPGRQPATGRHGDAEPYLCAEGYLHEFEDGRVECPLCGRGAYSRSEAAILQWEAAHDQCCSRRVVAATA